MHDSEEKTLTFSISCLVFSEGKGTYIIRSMRPGRRRACMCMCMCVCVCVRGGGLTRCAYKLS